MQIRSYAEKLIDNEVALRNVINDFSLHCELNDVFINHLLKRKYISDSVATCLRIRSYKDFIAEFLPVSRAEIIKILSAEFGFPPELIDKVLRRKVTSKIRFPKVIDNQ